MLRESILSITYKQAVRFEDITAGNMERTIALGCDMQYGRSVSLSVDTFSVYGLLTLVNL
jgi:hypothetical protein